MSIIIKQPKTHEELTQYFDLRWRILRAPWQQPQGSEKDELEDSSQHIIACNDKAVIGVGRMQTISADESQIRYMAVDTPHEGKGIGRKIVTALETISLDNERDIIVLDAREPAVGFYEKLGYEVTAKTYLLFNSIQHYRMRKTL